MTHPFHPLCGREFALVIYRRAWGEERVYYHDDAGKLRSLPSAWTSVSAVDPFVVLAAGRSPFRVPDLLELCRLMGTMDNHEGCRMPGEDGKHV
ncbi:MAG: hypothetical protein ISS72_11200 [Candidatus Brocadiae bacterium]|nr:hypothetical protein [Candidatus Brocadiia bacterium]